MSNSKQDQGKVAAGYTGKLKIVSLKHLGINNATKTEAGIIVHLWPKTEELLTFTFVGKQSVNCTFYTSKPESTKNKLIAI